MVVMLLERLPVEILQRIAFYLSFLDIRCLSKSCQHLRRALKDTAFGRIYLQQQAKYLEVDVNIEAYIGRLDTIDFGLNSKGDVVIHHCAEDASNVFTISVSHSGRVTTNTSTLCPWLESQDCPFIPIQTTAPISLDYDSSFDKSHFESCSTCKKLDYTHCGPRIDKNFRVFLVDWSDVCHFIMKDGAKLAIEIKVIGQVVNLVPSEPKCYQENVRRYGLRIPEEDVEWTEEFWKLPTNQAPAQPQKNDTPLYNPWI